MKHRLLVVFFILAWGSESLGLLGEKFGEPLHNELLERITEEYWADFKNKMNQLEQTYALSREGREISYVTHSTEVCLFRSPIEIKDIVTKIEVNQTYLSADKKKLKIDITYFGCSKEISFFEQFRIESGDAIAKWSKDEFVYAKRKWELKDQETLREHSIRRGNNQEVLTLTTSKNDRNLKTVVRTDGQNLLEMNWNGNDHYILPYDINVVYDFGGGGVYSTTRQGVNKALIINRVNEVNQYYDESEAGSTADYQLSPNKFDKLFRQRVLKSVERAVKKYMGFVIRFDLPDSEFSSSGTGNDRLVEELNRVILQVVSNPDQAILWLRNFLKEVKGNRVRDDRPKE